MTIRLMNAKAIHNVNLDDYHESLKLISENKRIGAIFYDMHTHVKIDKQSNKFDWPFTPTLISSRSFSTLIGAVLHPVLPGLQPGQV